MIRTRIGHRLVVRHFAAALTIAATAIGLVGCGSDAAVGSESDNANGELRNDNAAPAPTQTQARRTFDLDMDFTCTIQDMTTLRHANAPSAGRVKITIKFDDDPLVKSQVAAAVAARGANEFRKTSKITAGHVVVDVERDAIDGSGTKLKTHLDIPNLDGTVNADKEGTEAPYRLRYEISSSRPTRSEPAAGDAFLEDFWFTLYNLGRAGDSFTLAASSMRELDDGMKRQYCTARTVFADPVTGAVP